MHHQGVEMYRWVKKQPWWERGGRCCSSRSASSQEEEKTASFLSLPLSTCDRKVISIAKFWCCNNYTSTILSMTRTELDQHTVSKNSMTACDILKKFQVLIGDAHYGCGRKRWRSFGLFTAGRVVKKLVPVVECSGSGGNACCGGDGSFRER